jgi:hypothetical protein
MFAVETDPSCKVVKLTAAGHVELASMIAGVDRFRTLLPDVQPGFRLVTDLSGVKSMPISAAPHIAEIMELCDRHGVELVARILPTDRRHDIGFAILSQFHYSGRVRIVTCESLEEAMSALAG